jgi:hypothetical protein
MGFDVLTAHPDEFIEQIVRARRELDATFAGLTDDDLEEPGMTGVWSGRMTLVHIARWDETVGLIVLREQNGILPGVNEFDDYEAWNDYWASVDEGIPLAAARSRYETAHEAVVRTLQCLRPEEWTEYIRGWANAASLEHYLHHAETTRRWRAARS